MKLTDRTVANLPLPNKGHRTHWDADVKGLGVRVFATGVRSYVLRYRNRAGDDRTYTLGRANEWRATAARNEAKRLKGEIRVNGADPVRELQEERGAPTVLALWERYETEHLPKKRESSQREDRSLAAKYILPELRHRRVADIDGDDVGRLHRKITNAGRPVRANRVLALLSSMFTLASNPGRRQWRTDNPCKGVTRNPEEGRERFLEPEEIARLMRALADDEDQEAANAIMLALLTGARRGELLRATWDQFDLREGKWVKPSAHTKQKKLHRVPLNPPAVKLLKRMHADAPDKTGAVFPGRINERGRIDIRRPWERICMAAGLATRGENGRIRTDIRFHDLRHSYASMLAGSGTSLLIIGKLLGHTQPITTKRYAHVADDPLREATSVVGELVAGTEQ